MKILHVIEGFDDSSGGPAKSLSYLMREQEKLGHSVMVISTENKSPSNFYVSKFCLKWVSSKRTTSLFFYSWEFDKTLEETIKDFNPEVMHIHSVWSYPSITAMRRAIKKGIPFFLSPRSSLYIISLKKSFLKKKLLKILLVDSLIRRSAGIHVTESKEMRDILLQYPEANVTYSSHGVEAESPTNIPREEAAKILGLNKDYKFALFLSRVHPRKNVDKLLVAWHEALKEKEEGSEWKLIVAGPCEDNYKISLLRLANHQVIFFPMVTGVKKQLLLEFSDFFILPSQFENFGMAIAEALSVGLPVIATSNSPWAEIEDINAGLVIEPTIEEIKKSLVRFISLEPGELIRMGGNGKEYVQSKFAWKNQATDTLKMYTIK